jgi:hypothetical protein
VRFSTIVQSSVATVQSVTYVAGPLTLQRILTVVPRRLAASSGVNFTGRSAVAATGRVVECRGAERRPGSNGRDGDCVRVTEFAGAAQRRRTTHDGVSRQIWRESLLANRCWPIGRLIGCLAERSSAFFEPALVWIGVGESRHRRALGSQVAGVDADEGRLSGLTFVGEDGRTARHGARAMFVCIGADSRTGWTARADATPTARGYIVTGPDLFDAGRRPPDWPLMRDPFTA